VATNDLTIRPLVADDSLEELTDLLHRAYAVHAAAGLRFTARDQTANVTRHRIDGAECWVAAEDRRLIGTVTVRTPSDRRPGIRAGRWRACSISWGFCRRTDDAGSAAGWSTFPSGGFVNSACSKS
jgi:hypothetical protein